MAIHGLQVYDTSVSYFVNGTGPGYVASGTKDLEGAIRDSSGTFKLGQSLDGKYNKLVKYSIHYYFS